jgi:hypothetical protein
LPWTFAPQKSFRRKRGDAAAAIRPAVFLKKLEIRIGKRFQCEKMSPGF